MLRDFPDCVKESFVQHDAILLLCCVEEGTTPLSGNLRLAAQGYRAGATNAIDQRGRSLGKIGSETEEVRIKGNDEVAALVSLITGNRAPDQGAGHDFYQQRQR